MPLYRGLQRPAAPGIAAGAPQRGVSRERCHEPFTRRIVSCAVPAGLCSSIHTLTAGHDMHDLLR